MTGVRVRISSVACVAGLLLVSACSGSEDPGSAADTPASTGASPTEGEPSTASPSLDSTDGADSPEATPRPADACAVVEDLTAWPVADPEATASSRRGADADAVEAARLVAEVSASPGLTRLVRAWDDAAAVPGPRAARASLAVATTGLPVGTDVADACDVTAPVRLFETRRSTARFTNTPSLAGLRRPLALGLGSGAGRLSRTHADRVCGFARSEYEGQVERATVGASVLTARLLCRLAGVRVAVITDPRELRPYPALDLSAPLVTIEKVALDDQGFVRPGSNGSRSIGAYAPDSGLGLVVSGAQPQDVLAEVWRGIAEAAGR